MNEEYKILAVSLILLVVALVILVRWYKDLRILLASSWNFNELQKLRPRSTTPTVDTGRRPTREFGFFVRDPIVFLISLTLSVLVFFGGAK